MLFHFVLVDAERILKDHVQTLGDGEIIKVRRYPIDDTKYVKVVCKQDVTTRLVKKYIKQHTSEDVEVQPINYSKVEYVLECLDSKSECYHTILVLILYLLLYMARIF